MWRLLCARRVVVAPVLNLERPAVVVQAGAARWCDLQETRAERADSFAKLHLLGTLVADAFMAGMNSATV